MNGIELSVVIPAYQEEENLKVILPRVKKTLDMLNTRYEILVIDTVESMDNTKQVCLDNGARYINQENKNCYGDAVKTGIKYVNGTYTIFMDADGSHSPEFIADLYKYRNEYDVVVASRYVKGGGSANSRTSILMSLLLNMVYSWFLNLGCKDVSTGLKLYNTRSLKELHLISSNFEVIEEILVKLKRKNNDLKIKELPYFIKERMFGRTKRNLVAFIFSYFIILIKLKFFTGD